MICCCWLGFATTKKMQTMSDRLQTEKITFESELHDLLHEQDEFNEKLEQTNSTVHVLEEALKGARISADARVRALVEACIKSSEKLVRRATAENDVAAAAGTSSYFMMIADELNGVLSELSLVHLNYVSDNYKNVEALARKSILIGHLMASVYIQGITIGKTSANIECGESNFISLTHMHIGLMVSALRQESSTRSRNLI